MTTTCTDALPAGTRLREFEILSVIGQGGFGIVYLARDLTLGRRVAIKEYMPSALATRTQALTIEVRSSRHTETFAAGLRSFVNEARLLAQFDHPALLKVHRFWEDHGTAYMVMPYYAGTTFAKQLKEPGGPPDEARLRALLEPLLDALALMHAAHCYHRDIAPDNILMQPGGAPLLLDFGAARHVIGDRAQAPTVILKTGYAPIEQYGGVPELSQGAWTDLYALGSVIELAITGSTPPQALARFLADKREPLAVREKGRYSDAFLRAIDRSLAVLPKDRPQSVAEMRALLAAATPAPTPPRPGPRHDERAEMTVPMIDVVPPAPAPAPAVHVPHEAPRRPSLPAAGRDAVARTRIGRVAIGGAALAIVLAALAGARAWLAAPGPPSAEPAASAAAPSPPPAPAPAAAEAPPPAQPVEEAPAASLPRPVQPAPDDAEPLPATLPPFPSESSSRAASPRRQPAQPRLPREPAASPPVPPAIPNKKLPSARCADIIQRVSLGEPLSDAEKLILTRECRQ